MDSKTVSTSEAVDVRCIVDHSMLADADRVFVTLETETGILKLTLSQSAAESIGEQLTDLAFDLESAKDDLEYERDIQEADDWFQTKDDLVIERTEEELFDDPYPLDEDDMIGRYDLRQEGSRRKKAAAGKTGDEDGRRSRAVLVAFSLLIVLFGALLAMSMGHQ